jgi:zinc/manganese transport system substrate-binding protein
MRRALLSLILCLILVHPAEARLNVVATLPWIGDVAQQIANDQISLTTLIKPNQDPHTVEAKPSMILAARKADLLLYNGLDLEIGYLPLIIESSKNPKLMPGKAGNFDCSRFVRVIERPTAVDRSMGDVHPLGNPHYHFSPTNVLRVGVGMANAFAQMDPAHADLYHANFERFELRLREEKSRWDALPLRGKKFIAYHKMFEYLAAEFGFQLVGYVEPKPGIPPSAADLERLMESIKVQRVDAILTTSYQGKRESKSLSERSGVKIIVVPHDVGSTKGAQDWFSFMDEVLASLQ